MTATRITNVNFTKYIIKKYDQISSRPFCQKDAERGLTTPSSSDKSPSTPAWVINLSVTTSICIAGDGEMSKCG